MLPLPPSTTESFTKTTMQQSTQDIVNAIDSLEKCLSSSISQLSSTLSTLTSTNNIATAQIAVAISAPIIGALSAYLFNRFHWKTVDRNTKLTKMGDSLIDLVTELEQSSITYWTSDCTIIEKQQAQSIEITIKSKLRLIIKIARTMDAEIKKNNNKLTNYSSILYDLITGDDFESTKRKTSKQKAMKISYQCSDMRATITSLGFSG